MNSTIPFPRLEGEPAHCFAALLHHRDAGPGRAFSKTADAICLGESTLRRMAQAYDWPARLKAWDDAVLEQLAAGGAAVAEEAHRAALLQFRDDQHRRAELLAKGAEELLDLALRSTRAHIEAGTLLQPGQLGAALGSAARALEAAGSTAATALGVDEVLAELARLTDAPGPSPQG